MNLLQQQSVMLQPAQITVLFALGQIIDIQDDLHT